MNKSRANNVQSFWDLNRTKAERFAKTYPI